MPKGQMLTQGHSMHEEVNLGPEFGAPFPGPPFFDTEPPPSSEGCSAHCRGCYINGAPKTAAFAGGDLGVGRKHWLGAGTVQPWAPTARPGPVATREAYCLLSEVG